MCSLLVVVIFICLLMLLLFFFFFFKQKTAYEMRISDWSSDVCSSDLLRSRQQREQLLDGRVHCIGARRDMIEVDIGGGEARVAEQTLHLLQRVAQDQPVALHRPRRQCRFAQPLLDQQGEHMDCEGVTKLVGTDRQRETVLLAPLAGTGEDHLPRVGANRLPYLGQPSRRRLVGRSILVAQDQAASFLWGADIAHAVETGAGDRDRSFEDRKSTRLNSSH